MRNLLSIIITAIVLCMSTNIVQASIVTLSPEKTDWLLGEQVKIDVILDVESDALFAGGLDFFYNTTQLDYLSFAFDAAFNTASDAFIQSPTEGPLGSILSLQFSRSSGNYSNGLIGTLTFDTFTTGTGFGISVAENALYGGFVADGPVEIDPSFINASVDVNAIPIPSTILLLGGGLAALVGLRRRKSA
jgi:hypothetical protein